MHYRAKEFPLRGHIADADALMREMNRAMTAVDGGIDQNNIHDSSISYNLIRDSSGPNYMRSPSVVGSSDSSTGLFTQVQSAGFSPSLTSAVNSYDGLEEEVDKNVSWEWFHRTAAIQMNIELELRDTTVLWLVINGQVQLPNQSGGTQGVRSINEYDVRFMVNNTPLDEMGTFSCTVNEGFMPFHLQTCTVVRPGMNRIKAQIRDRSYRAVSATTPVLKYTGTYMYAYGYAR